MHFAAERWRVALRAAQSARTAHECALEILNFKRHANSFVRALLLRLTPRTRTLCAWRDAPDSSKQSDFLSDESFASNSELAAQDC
jgi:hypothetical protein